jgi:sulfur carrier protein ThiS
VGNLIIDTWLYGALAKYAGDPQQTVFANPKVELPEGSTIADLLNFLHLPTEQRGITFINGNLSAMPGLQPDLTHRLNDGDRVAFFHLKSMWPFQYRHGVAMIPEMSDAMLDGRDQGLRHSYSAGSESEQGKQA